ncbi:MAG: hypothetical protein LBR16_03015 [Treponema sp.]|nr:hypothetical protein [Treponema sp.]
MNNYRFLRMVSALIAAWALITGTLYGQAGDSGFTFKGDFTAIYTLGNAETSQVLPANGAGAYFSSSTGETGGLKKNGFYTQTTMYANFKALGFLEGSFKFMATSRPGSFYLPMQMEIYDAGDFSVTLDNVWARASLFDALAVDLPVSVYLKTGKYKAEASNYGTVSMYGTEEILDMLETGNDFNMELDVSLDNILPLTASFVSNYKLNEAIQRLYDEDGTVGPHGNPVVGQYAEQLLGLVKLQDLKLPAGTLKAEAGFGTNVSKVYSGYAAGLSVGYEVPLSEKMSLPLGLSAVYFQKNIDLLSRTAGADSEQAWGNTYNFRDTVSGGLGLGFRLNESRYALAANVGSTYTYVTHYYQEPISVLKLSVDALFTWDDRYFVGGGFIAGTLGDVEWKMKSGVSAAVGIDHTFKFAENFGYEVYTGVKLGTGRFVLGFNENRGLALNHMLEARTDGQIKVRQKDSLWDNSNRLVQAGGLYFKFAYSF